MPSIVYLPVVVVIVILICAFIFIGSDALMKVAQRALAQSNRDSARQGTHPRYELAADFLTAAERSFFGVLQQAVSSDFVIFAKVRLADVVRPVKNPSRSAWQSAFNRISGKHVDFILCEPGRLTVLLGIELDDRSHGSLERGLRDNLVDSALADARIPVLRVRARHSYAPLQLRDEISTALRPSAEAALSNERILQ